jgi:hypothetical protein
MMLDEVPQTPINSQVVAVSGSDQFTIVQDATNRASANTTVSGLKWDTLHNLLEKLVHALRAPRNSAQTRKTAGQARMVP